MANLKMNIQHDSWVEASIGPITEALVTIMRNHDLRAEKITWSGPTEVEFLVFKEGMTYAQLVAFRTEIENGVNAVSAKIKIFTWNDL